MTIWTHRFAAVTIALGVAAPAEAISTVESFMSRSNFIRNNNVSQRVGPVSLNRGRTVSAQRSRPATTFPVQTDVIGFGEATASDAASSANTGEPTAPLSAPTPSLAQPLETEAPETVTPETVSAQASTTQNQAPEPTVIDNYMLIVPFHNFANDIATASGWSVTVTATYHYTPTPMPAQLAGGLSNVTAAPVPPALAATILALGTLGVVGRRRRKNA